MDEANSPVAASVDDTCDYFQARRIINALDRAALIQGYVEQLRELLSKNLAYSGETPTNAPDSAADAAGG